MGSEGAEPDGARGQAKAGQPQEAQKVEEWPDSMNEQTVFMVAMKDVNSQNIADRGPL